MAHLLRDEDSTEKHLNVVRRHLRLCRLTRGADPLVAVCATVRQALADAKRRTEEAAEQEENVRDDLEVLTQQGADYVRSLHGRVQELDRNDPTARLPTILFDEEGFGAWLDRNGGLTPENAATLALRLGKLGGEHPLAPFWQQLETYQTEHQAAAERVAQAVRASKLAEAEEELAQAALRRAYEHSYLEARKLFGRSKCERLFPRLRRSRSAKPERPVGDEEAPT